MENVEILEELFDSKILAILRTLLSNRKKEFYLREISKESKVSVASTFRIINKFVKLGIVKQHVINKFKLYQINDNDTTKFLRKLVKKETKVLQIFVNKASLIPGVEMIIQHGPETKERANVLLIGQNIDEGAIKQACSKIRSDYGFTVSPLTLTVDQFAQMSKMGLYPEEKTVLFKKGDISSYKTLKQFF